MEKLILKNVRLSFPSVFKKAKFNNEDTKFEATLLLPKTDKKTYNDLMAMINQAVSESRIKVPESKFCIKDGDEVFAEKGYLGYEGCWAIKASNSRRPTVIDRDRTPLTEDDNVIYAGCYVNAIIDVWVQNNSFGKRVNGNLFGLQFVKDGERFGAGDVDVTDEFDVISDADSDDL